MYEIPLREKYGELENFRKIQLTFVSVVTLIVLAFLSLLLMNVTAPIIKLAEIARRIADGELEHTIDIRSTNEIGVLAQSFIVMQSSIKKKIT
ncbi:MAG: HAMP domain-containing protein, partial [Spirochaetales bacterium]|nr:HAMP domain-containing protein [Spirochaetales bacterium]